MNTKIKLAAVIALMLWGAAQVHAAQTNLVQTFNVQLSAWVQGPTLTNWNIITWSAVPKKVTTRDVILALGASTTNSFSLDARMFIVTPLPDGEPSIVVRDGTNTVDVSLFFRHTQRGLAIEKGRLNTNTGVAAGTEYSFHSFDFRDAPRYPDLTTHFDVNGYTMGRFCALLNSHAQVIGEAFEYVAFVSGTGDINGEEAIFRGTISGKGRRMEIQE